MYAGPAADIPEELSQDGRVPSAQKLA